MLQEMLCDPAIARSIRNPLVGTVFPFTAGMACNQDKIAKFGTGGGCANLTDSAITESSGKIGIGTSSPGKLLEVSGGDIKISGTLPRLQLNQSDATSSDNRKWSMVVASEILRITATNDSEQTDISLLALDRAGNVGIGTTSPAEKLDVAGTIKAQGLLAPLRVRVTNASFSTAAGEDPGTASFAAGDGGMEAQTGTDANSYDETIGGLITFASLTQTAGVTSGLNSDGAFLSARARWNSGSIGSADKFWILAGGLDSGELLRNGWGFKARDASGTKKLYGIVRVNGSETAEVDLSTTLTTGTWLDLYAVIRSGAVDYYVNGVLKNTASTTLPSTAASTYEVRVENGSGTNNAILQVAYLTVGLPI
ncbi:MAG: hypothetical protein HY651_03100 [Acidobacteria bacterium]|nr:hypothetical protein [Acidobacteriota bacterium]